MSESSWHLTTRARWDAAVLAGSYRHSTGDLSLAEVGYIHASYPHQLAAVAERFYADSEDLLVLDLDPDVLEATGSSVAIEPGDPADPDSPRFPHVYGPIPVSALRQTLPDGFDERGRFAVGAQIDPGPADDTP